MRSRVQAHVDGIGKADCRCKEKESQDENKDLPRSERLNADKDHAGCRSSTGRARARGGKTFSLPKAAVRIDYRPVRVRVKARFCLASLKSGWMRIASS